MGTDLPVLGSNSLLGYCPEVREAGIFKEYFVTKPCSVFVMEAHNYFYNKS